MLYLPDCQRSHGLAVFAGKVENQDQVKNLMYSVRTKYPHIVRIWDIACSPSAEVRPVRLES